MQSPTRFLIAGLTLSATLAISQAAHALDKAIVVGVNQYPLLVDASGRHPNLEGCVNDAKQMAAALKRYGFEVQLLTDATAKKADIVKAIKSTTKADRFVFYFAGHGTNGPDRGANLLPSDAKESGAQNDLGANELNQLVKVVPAKTRTVLLDSCFSGGMTRSFGEVRSTRPKMKLRFFARPATKSASVAKMRGSKDLILAPSPNKADDNSYLANNKAQDPKDKDSVCYFTATRANERAAEDEFNGVRRGVFSYYLAQRLNGIKTRWSTVQAKVSGDVASYMRDEQHPTLSTAFADNTIFDGGIEPAKTTDDTENLWDMYNTDKVDRSVLKLEMTPDKTEIKVGSRIAFEATTGRAGYLVLIEKGTSGKYNLLWPSNPNMDESETVGNKTIRIPKVGSDWLADDTGTERIRAIFFTQEEKPRAVELLNIFKDKETGEPQRSLTAEEARSRMKTRDFKLVASAPTPTTQPPVPFYTADITCEVIP